METLLTSRVRSRLAASCILAALLSPAAYAAAPDDAAKTVQAVWKPVEIKYSYVGFTTAYNCDAFEAKVKNILRVPGRRASDQGAGERLHRREPAVAQLLRDDHDRHANPCERGEGSAQQGATRARRGLTGKKDPLTQRAVPGAVEDCRPVARAPVRSAGGRLRADGRPEQGCAAEALGEDRHRPRLVHAEQHRHPDAPADCLRAGRAAEGGRVIVGCGSR